MQLKVDDTTIQLAISITKGGYVGEYFTSYRMEFVFNYIEIFFVLWYNKSF